MDAADRVAVPVFLSVGVKPGEIEKSRDALDAWLDAPAGKQAEAEKALVRALTA